MNQSIMGHSRGSESRAWRWGIALGMAAILYIAAVILFIIFY
jgi:hypothetical protein